MWKCSDVTLPKPYSIQHGNKQAQTSCTTQGRQSSDSSFSTGFHTENANKYVTDDTSGGNKSIYSSSRCIENELLAMETQKHDMIFPKQKTTLDSRSCYQFMDPWHMETRRHDPMMDSYGFWNRSDHNSSCTRTSSVSLKQQWTSRHPDAPLSSALDFIFQTKLCVKNIPSYKQPVYRPTPIYPIPFVKQGQFGLYSSHLNNPGNYADAISLVDSERSNPLENEMPVYKKTAETICMQSVNSQPIKSLQPVSSQSIGPSTVGASPFLSNQTITSQLTNYGSGNTHTMNKETSGQEKHTQYSFHDYDPKLRIQEPFMSFLIDQRPVCESAFTMINAVEKPNEKESFSQNSDDLASSQRKPVHLSYPEYMEDQPYENSSWDTQNLHHFNENKSQGNAVDVRNSKDSYFSKHSENFLQSPEDHEVASLTSDVVSGTDFESTFNGGINSSIFCATELDDTPYPTMLYLKDESDTPSFDFKRKEDGMDELKKNKVESTKCCNEENGIDINGSTIKPETGTEDEPMIDPKGLLNEMATNILVKDESWIKKTENGCSYSSAMDNKFLCSPLQCRSHSQENVDESKKLLLVTQIDSVAYASDGFLQEHAEDDNSCEDSVSNCSDIIPYAGQVDHSNYCKPFRNEVVDDGCSSLHIEDQVESCGTSDTEIYEETPLDSYSNQQPSETVVKDVADEIFSQNSENVKSSNAKEYQNEKTVVLNHEQTVLISENEIINDSSCSNTEIRKNGSDRYAAEGLMQVDEIKKSKTENNLNEQTTVSSSKPSNSQNINDSVCGRSYVPIKPKLMMIRKYEESNLQDQNMGCFDTGIQKESNQKTECAGSKFRHNQFLNEECGLFSDTAIQFVEKEYQLHLNQSHDDRLKQKSLEKQQLSDDIAKAKNMSTQKRKQSVSNKERDSKPMKKQRTTSTQHSIEVSMSSDSDHQTLNCPEDLEHCEAFHWCHVCEKSVKTEADSIKHINLHCGEGSKANLNYYYHQVYGNVTKHWRGYNAAEKCVYLCGLCERTIPYIKGFKRHIQKHGCRVYCGFCDRSFDNEKSLEKHQQSHKAEKPYHCTDCDRAFSTRGSFTMHRHSHHAADTYECQFCGKVLSSKGSLTTHTRLHTGDNPYKCRLCERSYPQNVQLKLHMKAHKKLGDI